MEFARGAGHHHELLGHAAVDKKRRVRVDCVGAWNDGACSTHGCNGRLVQETRAGGDETGVGQVRRDGNLVQDGQRAAERSVK